MQLKLLQDQFSDFLRDEKNQSITNFVQGDWLEPHERLSIYRNNFRLSLIEGLAANFPVVVELVDRAFFEPIAWNYIKEHPPEEPSLFSYGKDFPKFLAKLEALQSYPFIPEIAQFEYLRNKVANGSEEMPSNLDLSRCAVGELMARQWVPVSHFAWMAAHYPIIPIWQAHKLDKGELENLQITFQPNWLILYRVDDQVMYASIGEAEYRFLENIQAAGRLEGAVQAALDSNKDFDLVKWLGLLLERKLLRPM